MDPTSRRLVARIALWTGAILALMALWFFAIQPQLTPTSDTPGAEDVLVPEESSGEETPAEDASDPLVEAEAEADAADRNEEGVVVDEDGISEDDVSAPEPTDPNKPGNNGTMQAAPSRLLTKAGRKLNEAKPRFSNRR